MKKIDNLREQLINCGLQEGLQSKNVLRLSQQLDQQILIFMQRTHQLKHNDMSNEKR